jgi:hypothetical protein
MTAEMDKGTDTDVYITDTTSGSSIPFVKEVVDNDARSYKFDRMRWKKDKIMIKTPIKTKQPKNFAMRKV